MSFTEHVPTDDDRMMALMLGYNPFENTKWPWGTMLRLQHIRKCDGEEKFFHELMKLVCDKSRPAFVVPNGGCICPPTAERTCQGPLCPRRPIGGATCGG